MSEKIFKRGIQIVLLIVGLYSFVSAESLSPNWGDHVLGYFIVAASCIVGIIWLEIKK